VDLEAAGLRLATVSRRRDSQANPKKVAARAIVAVGSAKTSSTPARTGPTSAPLLSIIEATTLAAVSSAGVRTSHGRVDACSGR
jgi:hypothetical protein